MRVTRVGMYSKALNGWIIKDETNPVIYVITGVSDGTM